MESKNDLKNHCCYNKRKLPPSLKLVLFRVWAFVKWNFISIVFHFPTYHKWFLFLRLYGQRFLGLKFCPDWDQLLSCPLFIHFLISYAFLNIRKFIKLEEMEQKGEAKAVLGLCIEGRMDVLGVPDYILGLSNEIMGCFQVPFQWGAYAAAFAIADVKNVTGVHVEELLGPWTP